jgi:hypothetical protein
VTRWGREDIEEEMRTPARLTREERRDTLREQRPDPGRHCARCTAWRGCYLVEGHWVCAECL